MAKPNQQIEARLSRLEKELADLKAALTREQAAPWYRRIVGDFAGDEPPSDSDRVERLVSQLRVYLGEEGFTWLAALAIPPCMSLMVSLINCAGR